jgi:hypothetical protein
MLLTTSYDGCVNDPVSDYLVTNRKCDRRYLLAEHEITPPKCGNR